MSTLPLEAISEATSDATCAAASARNVPAPASTQVRSVHRRPRLGFLGVGWIGRHRMQAIADESAAELVVVADSAPSIVAEAKAIAPDAAMADSLDALLAHDLDGVVIATPSALHAAQTAQCLDRGVAVFCQKPLARTLAETRDVVARARLRDRLLGVDLSYRFTTGMQCVRNEVRTGALGDVYAIDLVFHNAYGPDKAWFRDPALSGGGCVIDLGIHLVDLALWTLDFPAVTDVTSRLYAHGRRLAPRPNVVEDFATATFDLASGATARLACSWNLSAGCDAVIEVHFHGTRGSAVFRNVDGSFYDFVAQRLDGRRRTLLAEPPDAWGGRAAVAWARALAASPRYDAGIERLEAVAAVLDAIYGR